MWCRDCAPPLGAFSKCHPATGDANREVNSSDCASGEFATGFSARIEVNFFRLYRFATSLGVAREFLKDLEQGQNETRPNR
jgi:hypothetical protein